MRGGSWSSGMTNGSASAPQEEEKAIRHRTVCMATAEVDLWVYRGMRQGRREHLETQDWVGLSVLVGTT